MSSPIGPPWSSRSWLQGFGAAVLDLVHLLGGLGLLMRDVLGHAFLGPFVGRPVRLAAFAQQSVRVGPRGLGVVFLVNFFVGMILALIGGYILQTLGFAHFVGNLMSVGIVVELGPLLTGVIMTGFIGAALAAEIGTMVVAEEITAIRTMALNPVRYIVAPRLLAVILMVPVLVVLGDLLALLGGLIVAVSVLDVPANVYFTQCWDQLDARHVVRGMIKAMLFGGIIGTVGCYRGFQATGGAEGVGRATTKAVVTAILLMVVTDAIVNYFILFRL